MGRKSNPNLVRLNIKDNEWNSKFISQTYEESSLTTFKLIEVETYISQFLSKNGLILHDYKIYINQSTLFIHISYFITLKAAFLINSCEVLKRYKNSNYKKFFLKAKKTHLKINDFRMKSKKLTRNSSIKNFKNHITQTKYKNNLQLKQNNFVEKFLETISLFTKNKYNVYFNFQNLNSKLVKNRNKIFWKKRLLQLKRYKKREFFKETINILFIMLTYKNSSRLLAEFLSIQFSNLTRHFYFLLFLKRALLIFLKNKNLKIKGVKIAIKGRINKRPKSKKYLLNIGEVPTQTVKMNINYHQSTSFSSNGTFGIKVWVAEK